MIAKTISRWAILLIAGLFSLQTMAGSVKLVDLLVDQSGLAELLTRKGIRGEAALEAKNLVNLSMRSLHYRNSAPSANQLKRLIKNLDVGDEDAVLYQSHLKKVLDTPAGELSKADIAKAIDGLMYLANRQGRRGAMVLGCSYCASSSLVEHGIKYTLHVPTSKESKEVLANVLPRKPKDLRNFISSNMRALGVGSYNKVSVDAVDASEERALGLFLALGTRGTKAQKDLVQTISKLGSDNDLFSSDNPHRLWKVLSNDFSDKQFEGWDRLLKEADQLSKSENKPLQDAFYEVLERRARDENIPMSKVENMKKKGCFFRK